MKHTFTLFIVFLSISIFAQCPEGDLIISSQEDLDMFKTNYPDCTEINGFLTVDGSGGNPINDLSALNNIEHISQGLDIRYTQLKSLSDLSNLKTLGRMLSISNNDDLETLSGLNNLTSIGGYLYLFYNPSLTSLKGLGNVESVGGELLIEFNPALTTLLGLENVKTVDGYMYIYFNESLESVEALSNIQSIDGDLFIESNYSLTTLDGFENLESINGYLYIEDNTNLTTINSLANINPNTVHGTSVDIQIINNPSLSDCSITPLCVSIADGKKLQIENNATSCNSVNEVKENCNLSNNNSFLNENIEMAIYPNPTTDFININSQEKINKVEIYSISGKLLEIVKNKNAISLEKYKQGSYIIVIYTNKGLIENKILKK